MTTATDLQIQRFETSGMFVWWDLDNTKVTPERLRVILEAEGFEPAREVPDIDAESAIKRATNEWAWGRGNQPRYRAEVTRTEAGVVTVGLLTRRRVDGKTVEWAQVAMAEYDSHGRAWTLVSDDEDHDAPLQAFRELADERMTYLDHRWIRPHVLMHAMGKADALSLRGGSGFYFVPRQHMDAMRQLRRILRRIGDCDLRLAVVGNDEDTVDSVAGAARESMAEALGAVEEQLQAWTQSARKVRHDSQANALGELARLISLAETYEAALGIRMDELRSNIEAARRRALQIVGGVA